MAASTREALKRKREEQDDVNGLSAQPAAAVSSTLSHEFVAPEGYSQPIDLDPNVHGELLLQGVQDTSHVIG